MYRSITTVSLEPDNWKNKMSLFESVLISDLVALTSILAPDGRYRCWMTDREIKYWAMITLFYRTFCFLNSCFISLRKGHLVRFTVRFSIMHIAYTYCNLIPGNFLGHAAFIISLELLLPTLYPNIKLYIKI